MDYPHRQLICGKGGGVTGQVRQYHLFENGTLFVGEGLTDKVFKKVGKISLRQANQLFDNYQTLQLGQVNFDHPGNLYKFIELKNGNNKHRITWGASGQKVNKEVQLFFDLFYRQVKTLNEE